MDEAYNHELEALCTLVQAENAKLKAFVQQVIADYDKIDRGWRSRDQLIIEATLINNQREVNTARALLAELKGEGVRIEMTDELLRLINDLKVAADHKSEYPVHTVSVEKFKPISDEDIERLHKGFEATTESEATDDK